MRGILIDDNGGLMVNNKTLMIGDNRMQIAQHIIIAFQGEYKHAPLLGGNARKLICGAADSFWLGRVKAQLKAEGVEANEVVFDNNNINVELK